MGVSGSAYCVVSRAEDVGIIMCGVALLLTMLRPLQCRSQVAVVRSGVVQMMANYLADSEGAQRAPTPSQLCVVGGGSAGTRLAFSTTKEERTGVHFARAVM